MDQNSLPPEGFFERLKFFAREAIENTYPVSVVTLTALQIAQPELAERIFIEAAIVPARRFLGRDMTNEIEVRLGEIERRFRDKEPVANLFHDTEVLVISRFIYQQFEREAPTAQQIMGERQIHPRLMQTHTGYFLLDTVVKAAVNEYLVKLAALRERRVHLLIARALIGDETLDAALREYAGAQRNATIQAVWEWLGLQNIPEEKRHAIMEYVTAGSDEHIKTFLGRLEGCAFLETRTVATMVEEIFSGKENIGF